MTISLKIPHRLAIVATALALGLGAFAAAPAQAQSITPHGTVVSAHGTVADKAAAPTPGAAQTASCDIAYWGSTHSNLCYAQTYYDGGDPYRWPVYELDLTAFVNRVWLHQNANNTGWSLCLSGGSINFLTGEYQDPGNIQVSQNTSPC